MEPTTTREAVKLTRSNPMSSDEDSSNEIAPRPAVTCECAMWGAPCPHFLWDPDADEDGAAGQR
ncbi:MAG: hypothetical protein ACXWFY_01730 [Chthoniobacterales bacterium]